MLSNAYFLAKIRFDTAENDLSEVEIPTIWSEFAEPVTNTV